MRSTTGLSFSRRPSSSKDRIVVPVRHLIDPACLEPVAELSDTRLGVVKILVMT